MRQVDAVVAAVIQVMPEFQKNKDKGNEIIVGELRKQVSKIIKEGILDGTIDYDKDHTDVKGVHKYVPGMVSNWLRRSKQLNGNAEPDVKNPGSRLGAGDKHLKVLRELRKTQIDDDVLMEIDKYIKERLSLLKKEKIDKKQKDINLDALPSYLRDRLRI